MKTLNQLKKAAGAALFVAFATLGVSPTAHAYVLPVVDFGNIVQTTITAIEEVESMIQDYVAYEEMLKANMAKLEGLDDINSNEMAFGIAASILGYSEQLGETLKDGKEITETLKSWYGASQKSPEDFMKSLAQQKAYGDQRVGTLMDHYQANGAAMQEAHSNLTKLNASVKNINGPTEGLQAVTAALGIMIKQNSSIMGLMQLDTMDKAQEQAKKNRENEALTDWQKNKDSRQQSATSLGK